MLIENDLLNLCRKYRTHTITEFEFSKLREWVNSSEENQQFFSNYIKLYKTKLRAVASLQANPSTAWQSIQRKRKRYRLRRKIYIFAAAACFFTAIIGSVLYLNSLEATIDTQPITFTEQFPELSSNKAMLTLSSGKQIILDNDSALVISDNGVDIANGMNNSLEYQKVSSQTSAPQYNIITVPMGSTFSLTLSDGTRVTLNSASSLRYPLSFAGERKVELNGEAYLDVAHNGETFTVQAGNKEIKVLGTRFNVSAYQEKEMVTTLVEGKVEIKSGAHRKVLLPGEQATVTQETGSISVAKVDTDLYTSWVSGQYDFTNTPLHTILSQLELWYNVKMVYKDAGAKEIRFDGTIFRNKSLGFSLEIIQQISDVQFTKENNVIVVTRHK